MIIWLWVVVSVVALAAVVVVAMDTRSHTALRRASRRADGTQEVAIVVDRGYDPCRIELVAGVPATLHFERRGDDPCTELLVSELWPNAHRLTPNASTDIRFTPERIGHFTFTCGMGMYAGQLIVREPAT